MGVESVIGMHRRIEIAALIVLAVLVLCLSIGTASAAQRSCGSVRAKLPSGSTQAYAVSVVRGTISCRGASNLITGVFLSPGVASAGPNNTSIDRLKSGWRCVFGNSPPAPVTCTKGANKVKATPPR